MKRQLEIKQGIDTKQGWKVAPFPTHDCPVIRSYRNRAETIEPISSRLTKRQLRPCNQRRGSEL